MSKDKEELHQLIDRILDYAGHLLVNDLKVIEVQGESYKFSASKLNLLTPAQFEYLRCTLGAIKHMLKPLEDVIKEKGKEAHSKFKIIVMLGDEMCRLKGANEEDIM